MIGTSTPVVAMARRAATIAALPWSRSCTVSIEQGVDPAGEQPLDLGDVGVAELGEADVAERRELRARARSNRSRSGAARVSRTRSRPPSRSGPRPRSSRTSSRGCRTRRGPPGSEPKVAVSTASTPASKNSECSSAIRSGRVSTRCSLQPSSDGTAEVVGAEIVLLDPGSEGPVEDEDAVAEGGEEVGHGPDQGTGACGRRASAENRASGPVGPCPPATRASDPARGRRGPVEVRRDLTGLLDPATTARAGRPTVVACQDASVREVEARGDPSPSSGSSGSVGRRPNAGGELDTLLIRLQRETLRRRCRVGHRRPDRRARLQAAIASAAAHGRRAARARHRRRHARYEPPTGVRPPRREPQRADRARSVAPYVDPAPRSVAPSPPRPRGGSWSDSFVAPRTPSIPAGRPRVYAGAPAGGILPPGARRPRHAGRSGT